jgi:copper chaperone
MLSRPARRGLHTGPIETQPVVATLRRSPLGSLPVSTVSLFVPGAHCGTCRAVVLHTLRAMSGVRQAELDLRDRRATVQFEPGVLDEAALCAALAEAGYPATPA